MCIITGFFDQALGGTSLTVLKDMLKVTANSESDDEGTWSDQGTFHLQDYGDQYWYVIMQLVERGL